MIPFIIAGAIGYGIAKLLEEDKAPKYADGGSVLLAQNGKPSNLTPQQYELVRTPAFNKWFGDWQNDPANASKVVDENGEPLVVYHGSNIDFNVFEKSKTNPYAEKQGYFFAFDKKYAESYNSKYVKPFFINIKIKGTFDDDDNLVPFNADGNIVQGLQVEVYDKKNIKLADGSNTTFDSNNPDIRFNSGGEARPFTDDGNKLVVFNQYRNYTPYKIAVDDVNNAEYITLWKTDTDTGEDKKMGYLRLNNSGDDFLSVSETSIDKGSKGLGLGLLMYKVALKYSSDKIKGIKSYLPDRTNKKQIPKIYKKLNSVKDGDYEFIYKENNPDIRFNEGGSVLLAPNGEPSNLTPEQYKLVRQKAFKKWFGDWENSPETSSKVVDENGEPLVVYHGTLNGGFNVFNMGKISSEEWNNIYGSHYRSGADPTSFLGSHFAKEKDVAENFLNGIYAHDGDNPKIYECFLNLRNVQVIDENDLQKKIIEQNVFNQFELEREFEYSEEFWELENDEMIDKYNNNKKFREEVNGSVLGQDHFEALSFANALADEYIEKLIKHKIDGIEYLNRKEGGTSFIALYQNQIKLADGSNTTFDSNNNDIRFDGGGEVFYHGSTDKNLEGKKGIHIGTKLASTEALESRIGVPSKGEWDGKRKYGKTLLAGKKRLKELEKERGYYLVTGYNTGRDIPEEDYYPTQRKERAVYSDGTPIPFDSKPIVFPVKIKGRMTNSKYNPHTDDKANSMMLRNLKMGNAKSGYYYTNIAEDEGSISAVVPDKSFIEIIDNNPDIRYAGGGEIESVIEQVKLEVDLSYYKQNIQYHSLYPKLKNLNFFDDDEKVTSILVKGFINDVKAKSELVNGKIRLYRALAIKNIEKLNVEKLGIYWSVNEDKTGVFDDEGYEHKEKPNYESVFIIRAEFNTKDIDWQNSFDLYVMNDWMEGEIRVVYGSEAYNLKIKKSGDKKWLNI